MKRVPFFCYLVRVMEASSAAVLSQSEHLIVTSRRNRGAACMVLWNQNGSVIDLLYTDQQRQTAKSIRCLRPDLMVRQLRHWTVLSTRDYAAIRLRQ